MSIQNKNPLSGTKTEQNLRFAFSGEAEARDKYTFFADAAKNDGFEQIAAIFQETASNEKAHAELWLKALGSIGTTQENLENAARGEHYEWAEMYARFAQEAREEGFSDLAAEMDGVAAIEREHEARFRKLLDSVRRESVFEKAQPIRFICRNCGHSFVGTSAPELCPVCKHVKAFFQEKAENY